MRRAARLAAGLALLLSGISRAEIAAGVDKIEPSLRRAGLEAPLDSVLAWVCFADRGSPRDEDLARQIERAAASLSPRARARRERAGMHPIADALDVPVAGRHLAALRERGFQPFAVSRWFNRAAVHVPAGRLGELADLAIVRQVQPVERARRTPRFTGSAEPSAPNRLRPEIDQRPAARAPGIDYGRSLAQLRQINAVAVHDSGYIGTGVLVCMLDSGFRSLARHESTRDIVVPPGMSRDFAEGDTTVADDSSAPHGLWTLACAGAKRDGALVGAAPGASFALARTEVENSETIVEMLYWAQGAEWADSLGADIISSSLGYTTFPESGFGYEFKDMDGRTTTVSRAAQIAVSRGILVVSSVGNLDESWRHLAAPADVNGDSLIAVGAVTLDERLAFFSAGGPTYDRRLKPDLVACGVANPLPRNDDSTSTEYIENSGTSLAAPLVAGLAACLMQARPQWSAVEVVRALRETADRYRIPNLGYGYGVPDGLAALRGEPGSYGLRALVFRDRLALSVDGPNPAPRSRFPIAIRIALAAAATAPVDARLDVLDLNGRVVASPWSGRLSPGQTLTTAWDGGRSLGRSRPGIHWILLRAGGMRNAVRVVSL